MPLKCTNRPNRSQPRDLDAQRIASMVCWYINRGGSEEALRLEMRDCLDTGDEDRCERERTQLRQAAGALEQAERSLEVGIVAMAAILAVVSAVALVARFVPAARPAGLLLGRVTPQLAAARASMQASLEVARIMARAIRSGQTVRLP